MRYTLIEMTQRVLEALGSDEVSNIDDTEESRTVANIIKECYFDIIGKLDLPEKEDIFSLTGSGDSEKPCLMTLPDGVLDLNSVYYNNGSLSDPTWYEVEFIAYPKFVEMNNNLDTDEDNVGTMSVSNELGQSYTFKYRNDVLPSYYTSFDDRQILFDSYDASVNTTLVGAKTMCHGALEAEFSLTNTYIPELDPRQFQLLLQASKAQAFVELKQIENPKAERKERKNEILAQRTKHAIDRRGGSKTYRRYGRK